MPIDYDKLMNWPLPDAEVSYGWKDCALYALGLGLGDDPTDVAQLRFVYEKDIVALPTMASVIGQSELWIADPMTGIHFTKVVHGEESLEILKPLPAEATMAARHRVDEIVDKGEGRGMILTVRTELSDKATGTLHSIQRQSMFCRDNGGFGGPTAHPPAPITMPDREPDIRVTRQTFPEGALIYRLSGDLNLLHVDPQVARKAGFERPILHGLATFGLAGYSILERCAGGDVARFRAIASRFTAPVYPGETLRFDIWNDGPRKLFRCTSLDSGKLVLDRGTALID